jgi:hypothetical protein
MNYPLYSIVYSLGKTPVLIVSLPTTHGQQEIIYLRLVKQGLLKSNHVRITKPIGYRQLMKNANFYPHQKKWAITIQELAIADQYTKKEMQK